MHTLLIHFENAESGSLTIKRAAPGQTLLEVLLAHRIAIRHDCGGVCHCTTCHLHIEKGAEFIEEKSKREADFLRKVRCRDENSRLACQCLLLDGSGRIHVRIAGGESSE